MKYIVTGGAGFIGSHLIEKLVAENNQVVCIDDLSSGFLSNIISSRNVSLLNMAVQNIELEQLESFDGIFHLAAQASVPKSIDDFFNSSKNNLLSTLKVWDWANKLNIPIVYASSSAIYGNLPLGDDRVEKFDILSPYAQDKLTMEHYANMAWNVYQTKSIGLRFFNVYGPKQDPSNPYSGVISIFIDRLLKGLPLTVNGGYQTRDFVYVKDIVNCLVHSMKEVQNCSLCTSFNVGTGKSVTIDSLLANLIEITKSSPCINKEKLPLGDPEISAGTYEKLKNNLGINIKHFTSLNEGLNLTVKYIIDNERNAKV
jgi:UDP-glucose 4-epimerase